MKYYFLYFFGLQLDVSIKEREYEEKNYQTVSFGSPVKTVLMIIHYLTASQTDTAE